MHSNKIKCLVKKDINHHMKNITAFVAVKSIYSLSIDHSLTLIIFLLHWSSTHPLHIILSSLASLLSFISLHFAAVCSYYADESEIPPISGEAADWMTALSLPGCLLSLFPNLPLPAPSSTSLQLSESFALPLVPQKLLGNPTNWNSTANCTQ